MQVQSLQLHKGREQSLLRRHPWIFSRAIKSPTKSIMDGDIVQILDSKGDVMGVGHYQDSSLSVRMLAFEDVSINDVFWQKRINDAAQCREDLHIFKSGHTDAFRLVHGEGDQLPGLIIDIYGEVAVLQAHSIGMHKARQSIANALMQMKAFDIKAVFCKSHDALPSSYSSDVADEWLTSPYEKSIIVSEGGIKFMIDVVSGQKTGFFLDQRENRDIVRRYSKEVSLLNCFSYSGGFTLYALQGGADEVVSVDTSAGALTMLEENLQLNQFTGKHESLKENVMTFLTNSDRMFDIVIVDPPAFAKSLSKRHNAIQAYKRLNMMAMARVKKGGMLFTFSCSQVVDKELFANTIVAAAIESGRQARVVHEMGQGPDHPVSIFHPEGHYLKGLALYMD